MTPDGESCLVPGQLVARRYRIVRLLGRGGMGEVYEAQDELIHEAVALKTLRLNLVAHAGVAARFESEMRLARKVAHPSVCRVFEVGSHEMHGEPPLRFITMELLHGELLSARIRRLKRLTKEQAFPLAGQMAAGLQAAHDVGIVHADFKSSNVIIVPGPDGDRAKITDFGLARIDPGFHPADETRTIHDGGKLVGTVAYMSPEQMEGSEITTASDIYSLGIVLFEMATGQRPFDGSHVIHAAMQRVSGESIAPRKLVPNLDRRWEIAIVRCLQRDRKRRFGSAAEVAEWFGDGDGRPFSRWTRREWFFAAGAAAAGVGGIGGYWVWSHVPYSPKPLSVDWYRKGVGELHSTTYESARRSLEQAVAADPQFALAYASLAQAYEELDYTELAKDSILKAMTVAQETRLSAADERRLKAYQFMVSREYERAAPLLQELERAASPEEKPAAALELGWLAELEDKRDEAVRDYERALDLNPSYAAAKLRLGQMLQRRRELPAALKNFQDAERLFQASSDYEGVTEALWGQANLLNRSGRAKEALPLIDRALADARTVRSLYLEIRLELLQGVAYRTLGDHARAEEIASAAIDRADAEHMDNLASSALMDLGNSYMLRGDVKAAEPAYRRALDVARRGKVRGTAARALMSLASFCEQAGRPAEAIGYIQEALPFYREGGYRLEVVKANTVLGGVYSEQADYKQGIQVLSDALPEAVKLGDPAVEEPVRERLAEALRDQGDWPAALGETGKALALLSDRESAEVRLIGAGLLWGLGRRNDSAQWVAEVERVLRQNPSPSDSVELRLLKAEIACDEGRFAQVGSLAGDGSPRAALLRGVAAIRMHREDAGLKIAAAAVEEMEKANLLSQAAQARLLVSEALVAVDRAGSAGTYAGEALEFFEPRGIAEACWRAHLVAALAAGPESDRHREAARAALGQLKAVWPAQDVASYMARPEIGAAVQRL
jgi:serine/threonine protein kinase